MGLNYKPDFAITANDSDITNALKKCLVSVTVTDNSGNESDRLAITIAPPQNMATPKKGAVLKLALGFNGDLVNKGQFVVDEVTASGPPRRIQIVGNAAPMNNTKQTGALQTQKTRAWDNKTLGDIVKTVAADHGLTPKISDTLNAIVIEHLDQAAESDMNLMTRLAKMHGAVSKPAGGFWLFVTEGEGKSATGKTLSSIDITPSMASNWQARFSSRNDTKRVSATYFDTQTGETKEVSAGFGEPAAKIVFRYPNKAEAEAAVAARAKTVQEGSDTLDIAMPATPELMAMVAEGEVKLAGFGDVEDGAWRVKSCEWALSESGLQVRVSAGRGKAK